MLRKSVPCITVFFILVGSVTKGILKKPVDNSKKVPFITEKEFALISFTRFFLYMFSKTFLAMKN